MDLVVKETWWRYYQTLPDKLRRTFFADLCRYAFDGDTEDLKPYLAEIYGQISKPPKIDFSKLQLFFNTTCANFPSVRTMTKKRRSAVQARMAEHGKGAIFEVIKKASVSPFLNGGNGYGWKASFDWLFAPTNFVKVLEGNYDAQSSNTVVSADNFKSTL